MGTSACAISLRGRYIYIHIKFNHHELKLNSVEYQHYAYALAFQIYTDRKKMKTDRQLLNRQIDR